ncbi:hypothetical protein N7G274_010562 [Stereocaulon virgatum]|uniref:Uncharacterized protein n=1 Tax=Stereocaulon virgatum TaxID=373712 RepID=A0ABR3ZVE4_9LECA
MDETFTLLPLHLDPTSKAITSPNDTTLTPHLSTLHTLHRTLLSLPSQIPPPPFPTNPKRSAQIQKMRDQGNASFKPKATAHPAQAQAHEAIKLYTYGLEMALGRPSWEPSQLVREEASALFANRAQAYMAVKMWAEGAADAETSVELKRGPGNAKAWWRRGKCLVEMGRWEEAGEWVRQAVEVEGEEKELVELGKEIEAHFRQVER